MKTAVVGAGAWGTALAILLCKNGHDTTLWCRSEARAAEIRDTRVNPRLPKVELPRQLHICADPSCVADCQMVVIASPSFPIRQVLAAIAPYLRPDTLLVSVTKGIEDGTLLRMSQVVSQETGHENVVALTGPCHAEEVAVGIPSGCLAACGDKGCAELVQDAFMSDTFRVYTSPDVVGAELGGALKNVIALCAGVVAGLGFGDNTKAMLMTRGLTEMARLGVSLGAQKSTLAGLSGIGDLIVTCTSQHSRNNRAGMLIGQGCTPRQAMEQVGAVVEGYYASKSAWELCQKQNVEMPIIHAAYQVLYEGANPRQAVSSLLLRQRRAESEDAGWL
ncbi:MAG: NAD(P)-dependent glycerol-3-phosphate dehydrogenase [Firmicutes bacterium]|nr:NAD(P)-dependent glycerol-3-phosphate dehydrogenase [Bacillota bacterium]MDY6159406.1 NAD(P)H-dependent glycerol-3-phosphate dehydrogenase [Candidatus Faecousia sp.]